MCDNRKKEEIEVQVNKSAKDGKFVSAEFEKTHPATTFKETVKKQSQKK